MTTDFVDEGTLYLKPDTYTLDAKDYNKLLKSELMLKALLHTGVSDWTGFGEAVEMYEQFDREMV